MTSTPPRIPSLFEQFMSAAASAAAAKADTERPPWPTNPFPRGIRDGSATDRVLAELRRVAPQALEAGQLRHRCQAKRGAVAWAVRYLEEKDLIEKLQDPRSTMYLRYRLKKGTP